MKKITAILMLCLLVLASIPQVSATTSVFLTSDNVLGPNDDVAMLNSIKEYVEEISNGNIQVNVDPNAPSPGEGTRAIESDSDVSVNIAACCAGNLLILSKYASSSSKHIIFVNIGTFDLEDSNYLRRAWDDNYSTSSFAGIKNPGDFVKESGIDIIEPLKEYPNLADNGILSKNDDGVNKYIAEKIVDEVNNYNNNSDKQYDTNLITNHHIKPSTLAKASDSYVKNSDENKTYESYTPAELLYLNSVYISGEPLKNPENYDKSDSPLKYSLFTKDEYSLNDYINMANITKNYMDENHKAPDYIIYNGAVISYYDLSYNFAQITDSHTDMYHQNFERGYIFDKVNSSFLIDILPIAIVLIIIFGIYLGIKRIRHR